MTRPGDASDLGARLADLLAVAWIAAFAAVAVAFALAYPFGHAFDEIEHYSMIVALHEAPTLFPDLGAQRILAADRAGWSQMPNYLAHPPLHHLAMGPLAGLFPGDVRPVRLAGAALVLVGLLAAWVAGRRRLASPADRLVFTFALFGLPATWGVAALINNDAALVCEFGLLFAALAADRRRPVVVGLLVAAIGWTKFNGFAAALILLALLRLFELRRDGWRPTQTDVAAALGAAVGAVPTIATLLRWGRPVWRPERFPDWFDHVRPEIAATLSPFDYAVWFFDTVARRFPARIDSFDLALPLLGLIGLAALALRPAAGPDRGRDLARAGVVALLLYAALHLGYGWRSMRETGSMVEAQSRYYLAPWVFFAFALPIGIATLPATVARLARALVVAVVVVASVPASLVAALVAPAAVDAGHGGDRRPGARLLAPAVDPPPPTPPAPPGR
ncbi:MAG: hypothetical protein OEL76_08235 [Siculibacillus sp.]|nr:hypothetical protein [Siculibacillus sp.]